MNRLLLIEDCHLDRRLAIEGLCCKFDVDTAEDFPEAERKLTANTYIAIIVDLKIPGIDMRETVPAVKKMAKGAAIIVLSGYSDKLIMESAIRSNACQFLVKGVSDRPPKALAAAVEVGIMTHATLNKLDAMKNVIRDAP